VSSSTKPLDIKYIKKGKGKEKIPFEKVPVLLRMCLQSQLRAIKPAVQARNWSSACTCRRLG